MKTTGVCIDDVENRVKRILFRTWVDNSTNMVKGEGKFKEEEMVIQLIFRSYVIKTIVDFIYLYIKEIF